MKNTSTVKDIYANFMNTNQKNITKNLLNPIRALKNVGFVFDMDGRGTSEFSDDSGSVYVSINGDVSFCHPDPTAADIEYIMNL